MQGIVCVNKEKGWTSFDVVKKIKKIFNTSKVGHLGTLDPMAEGVLPVAIGKATKLFDLYLHKTKEYIAEFEFGYETDTLDLEGEIIAKADVIPTLKQIEDILPKFVGKLMQVPPKYSAIKINGRRAYDLARKDIDFSPEAKEIEIYKISCLRQISQTKFEFVINCSAGTYIRSIARDLANGLKTVATMTALKRIKAGNFEIGSSKTIAEIESFPESSLITLDTALGDLPTMKLPQSKERLVKNGVKVRVNNQEEHKLSRVYINEELLGVGEIIDGQLQLYIRLYEGEN